MVLVIVTVVLGTAVGYLGGGRLRRLADVDLSRVWLLVVAFGAQVLLNGLTAAGVRTGAAGTALLVASQAALVGFVWANRVLPGMLLVAVGFGLNALVIVANGAMPVSRDAIAALTSEPVEIAVGKHRLLEAGDPLPWLADVIPVPVLRQVVSIGDVVLALGVAVLVAALMLPRGRHAVRRSADAREDRPVDDRSAG